MNQKLMTTREVAEAIGLATRTLENMRMRGDGPPFIKLGTRVFYHPKDIDSWINDSRRRSTSDDGQQWFAG